MGFYIIIVIIQRELLEQALKPTVAVLNQDVVSAGWLQGIQIQSGEVKLQLNLAFPSRQRFKLQF